MILLWACYLYTRRRCNRNFYQGFLTNQNGQKTLIGICMYIKRLHLLRTPDFFQTKSIRASHFGTFLTATNIAVISLEFGHSLLCTISWPPGAGVINRVDFSIFKTIKIEQRGGSLFFQLIIGIQSKLQWSECQIFWIPRDFFEKVAFFRKIPFL